MCVRMCQVAARQFPVERHFAARTEEDYLAAAYKMVSSFYVVTISLYCLRGSVGVLRMTKKKGLESEQRTTFLLPAITRW